MHYFQVSITRTSKNAGSKEPRGKGWSTFDREEKKFTTLDEVKAFLKEEYGKCKREKIYRDDSEAGHHVGYCYHFRNKDWSHNSPEWYQQDWVEVNEMTGRLLIV